MERQLRSVPSRCLGPLRPLLMVAPHADADLKHDLIRRGWEIGETMYERLKLVTRLLLGDEARFRVRSDSPKFAAEP
jgi:hypothetical protein